LVSSTPDLSALTRTLMLASITRLIGISSFIATLYVYFAGVPRLRSQPASGRVVAVISQAHNR
jgi:hypothetical protein